jgi:hypothetical protein
VYLPQGNTWPGKGKHRLCQRTGNGTRKRGQTRYRCPSESIGHREEPAIPVLTKRSEHPQMRTAFSRPAPASEDASLRKLEAQAGIADYSTSGSHKMVYVPSVRPRSPIRPAGKITISSIGSMAVRTCSIIGYYCIQPVINKSTVLNFLF